MNNQQLPPTEAYMHHTHFENALAILIGTFLVSFGLALFKYAGILIGGTAGISLIIHYATNGAFGWIFFLINLPFYLLAIKKMGWSFTWHTFIGVFLISVFTEMHASLLHIETLQKTILMNPFYIAVIGGMVMAMGFIALFRHHTSLGGISILALYAQEYLGVRAGWVLLGTDIIIVFSGFLYASAEQVAASILGAVVINIIILINHRPGRYIGT